MMRHESGLEPELEALLNPRRIWRIAPSEVRARALAQARAIARGGWANPARFLVGASHSTFSEGHVDSGAVARLISRSGRCDRHGNDAPQSAGSSSTLARDAQPTGALSGQVEHASTQAQSADPQPVVPAIRE